MRAAQQTGGASAWGSPAAYGVQARRRGEDETISKAERTSSARHGCARTGLERLRIADPH